MGRGGGKFPEDTQTNGIHRGTALAKRPLGASSRSSPMQASLRAAGMYYIQDVLHPSCTAAWLAFRVRKVDMPGCIVGLWARPRRGEEAVFGWFWVSPIALSIAALELVGPDPEAARGRDNPMDSMGWIKGPRSIVGPRFTRSSRVPPTPFSVQNPPGRCFRSLCRGPGAAVVWMPLPT